MNDRPSEQSAIQTPHSAIVILTTTETAEQAERLAHLLMEKECAACVQILPPMTSIYRWQGRVEQATEHLLLIKTLSARYAAVAATLKAHHPYQTPEIIALPVVAGAAEYLAWLTATVKS